MTALRRDAEAILYSALAAVEPERLVVRTLPPLLDPFPGSGPIPVIGFGKAAVAMARGARRVLESRFGGGLLVTPAGAATIPPGFTRIVGGHPLPDEGSVSAARALLEFIGDDPAQLLFLISGGGSALVTLPPDDVPLEDVRRTTALLSRAGADIEQVNLVRRQLDRIKGGRLARAAVPARVLSLVLSDVVGDRLDVIASGPLSPGSGGAADAIDLLDRLQLMQETPRSVRDRLERDARGEVEAAPLPDDDCFAAVETVVIGSGRLAAEAAAAEAERRGYAAAVAQIDVEEEARLHGEGLARWACEASAGAPACRITAGETRVRIDGEGLGGRTLEVALGAVEPLAGATGALVAALATDGIDGPTPAAGAIATGRTLARARECGLDPAAALAGNDSYPFFDRLGDLIVTGPTGTNVADIHLALVG